MERELTELYPCPYSVAVRCNLQDPCKGCETWAKYLVGEEISRMVPQPERKTEEEILERNGFFIPDDNQYLKAIKGMVLKSMHEFALQSREMPSEEEKAVLMKFAKYFNSTVYPCISEENVDEWLKSKLG